MSTTQQQPPSLNVYKKIAVIRYPSDTLTYEDNEGNTKSVTIQELGDAITTATPIHTKKIKLDIPIPKMKYVEYYNRDISPAYQITSSYVRYQKQSIEEFYNTLDYIADYEDEMWLQNNPKFGTIAAVTATNMNNNDNGNNDNAYVDDITNYRTVPSKTGRRPPTLPLRIFEHMFDLLEKATGFESIITQNEAEMLFMARIPQIFHLFKSSSSTSTTSTQSNVCATAMPVASSSIDGNSNNVITAKNVIHDIYNYWVQKRCKLKRPLLRKYWPVTSSDDTNPHLVFRPRNEKEKYKLRVRKRTTTTQQQQLQLQQQQPPEHTLAILKHKLQIIRNDLDNYKTVLELIQKREEIYSLHVHAVCELFHQRLYDIVDTSGKKRKISSSSSSQIMNKQNVEQLLESVPTYFESIPTGTSRRNIYRIRNNNINNNISETPIDNNVVSATTSSAHQGIPSDPTVSSSAITNTTTTATLAETKTTAVAEKAISTTISGVPKVGSSGVLVDTTAATTTTTNAAASSSSGITGILPTRNMQHQIAGRNSGEPAPNFLHPLETRESYITSWEQQQKYDGPYIRTYENGQPLPTYHFRHRPRIGRGGRVIIDRLPTQQLQPSESSFLSVVVPQCQTFYRAGIPLQRYKSDGGRPKEHLLDLLPRPLNHSALSRKIEAISIAAIQEDYDAAAAIAAAAARRSSNSNMMGMNTSSGTTGSSFHGPAGVSSSSFFTSSAGNNNMGGVLGDTTLPDDNENQNYEEVIVRLEDYLETDDQLWGEEHYSIGPI